MTRPCQSLIDRWYRNLVQDPLQAHWEMLPYWRTALNCFEQSEYIACAKALGLEHEIGLKPYR
jgi:hypothetical protein